MTDRCVRCWICQSRKKRSAGWSIRRVKSGSSPTRGENVPALPRARAPSCNDGFRRAGIGRGNTSSPTVYLVGAGTSDYTGRALAGLLRRRWSCEVWAIPSTTLLTEFEEFHRPGKEYLWISFSRSGESPEGVALLEQAIEQHREIRHLVVTCNPQGAMAQLCLRHADRAAGSGAGRCGKRPRAGDDEFVQQHGAGGAMRGTSGRSCEVSATWSQRWRDSGGDFFLPLPRPQATITSLGCTRTCFVGAGALRAVADESGLKVMELSAGKVTTLAETPLGLRHGPLSSVDGQTVFVAFLSSEPRRRGYELDLLREIDRKRLGRVRAVVTAGEARMWRRWWITVCLWGVPRIFPTMYRPVLDVMLGQLIGLFASMRCGLKPDQPSPAGTITRVVAPIKLYA